MSRTFWIIIIMFLDFVIFKNGRFAFFSLGKKFLGDKSCGLNLVRVQKILIHVSCIWCFDIAYTFLLGC